MQLSIVLFLASVAAAQSITQLSPEQTSQIRAAFETLTATRADVKSVQSAVRSEIPTSYFDDDKIGPFYQSDLASLEQAATPVFTTPVWFTQLDPALQTAFMNLEPDALIVEKSIIDAIVNPQQTTLAKRVRGT